MAYQAITDLIVNTAQLQDLQLSNPLKESSGSTPATSFSDYLASFQKDESVSSDKVENTEKPVTSETKTESSSAEKTEKLDETQKKTEPEESKDKISEDKEVKVSEKNIPSSEKNAVNNASGEADQAKFVSKNDDKAAKKLSKKDFSRIEEIVEKAGAPVNAETAVENLKNAASIASANNKEIKFTNTNTDSEELDNINPDVVSDGLINQTLLTQPDNAQNNNSASEFDFSGKNEASKKQFALDKDGKIIVTDLRTEENAKSVSFAEQLENKKSVLKTSDIKMTGENTAVMSVELNPNAQADVLSLNNQTAAANGSNFQAMLSNQLHNVAPEFVKAGNLVLKDNNQGTINLVLHPDDLGNVKIHLSLDGKTLSGHITVATKEALQVFKDNAETLREAFIKNGFENAQFDVAFSNNGSFNQNMDFASQQQDNSLLAKRSYSANATSALDSELEAILSNAEDISNYSVNIVA